MKERKKEKNKTNQIYQAEENFEAWDVKRKKEIAIAFDFSASLKLVNDHRSYIGVKSVKFRNNWCQVKFDLDYSTKVLKVMK